MKRAVRIVLFVFGGVWLVRAVLLALVTLAELPDMPERSSGVP